MLVAHCIINAACCGVHAVYGRSTTPEWFCLHPLRRKKNIMHVGMKVTLIARTCALSMQTGSTWHLRVMHNVQDEPGG